MRTPKFLSLTIAVTILLAVSGCDWSAKWDLRQADKALKEADKHHAEVWAEKEYRKAQVALGEAMDLAKVRVINEARDKAAEAKMWAEEATELAIERYEEMQEEKARLGVYQP